jgi:hypothetical protein
LGKTGTRTCGCGLRKNLVRDIVHAGYYDKMKMHLKIWI